MAAQCVSASPHARFASVLRRCTPRHLDDALQAPREIFTSGSDVLGNKSRSWPTSALRLGRSAGGAKRMAGVIPGLCVDSRMRWQKWWANLSITADGEQRVAPRSVGAFARPLRGGSSAGDAAGPPGLDQPAHCRKPSAYARTRFACGSFAISADGGVEAAEGERWRLAQPL